jgi:hypothetical protein
MDNRLKELAKMLNLEWNEGINESEPFKIGNNDVMSDNPYKITTEGLIDCNGRNVLELMLLYTELQNMYNKNKPD